LIETGTPSRSPAGAPAFQRASLAAAERSADSASTTQNAFSTGFSRSMRASAAFVASTGEARPLR
jgi:hypothetical protein